MLFWISVMYDVMWNLFAMLQAKRICDKQMDVYYDSRNMFLIKIILYKSEKT